MGKEVIINIAKDFSRMPAGRYAKDGPYSGENFREKLLVPALKKEVIVRVVLDGARGYGSSFLEEAFGGIIRGRVLSLRDLNKKMTLVSESDPTLITEINEYMQDAAKEVK